MSRADDLADIESGMLAMRGMNNAVITAAETITAIEAAVAGIGNNASA